LEGGVVVRTVVFLYWTASPSAFERAAFLENGRGLVWKKEGRSDEDRSIFWTRRASCEVDYN